jgi:hypothetical protein
LLSSEQLLAGPAEPQRRPQSSAEDAGAPVGPQLPRVRSEAEGTNSLGRKCTADGSERMGRMTRSRALTFRSSRAPKLPSCQRPPNTLNSVTLASACGTLLPNRPPGQMHALAFFFAQGQGASLEPAFSPLEKLERFDG